MRIRFNNIEIRFYNQKSDEVSYEIVCWQPNPYYGTEDSYIYDKEIDMYTSKVNKNFHIAPSCFKNPETCFVLGWINKNGECWDITTVSDRPWNLESDDFNDYNEVVRLFYSKINIDHGNE